MFRKALMAGAIAVAVLWLANTSLLGARPEAGNIKLLSHRGVHQTFSPEDLENDTCTASRILPPAHEFIENTLPSMQAAFQYGAAVVELDIHLTPDGKFACLPRLDARLQDRRNGYRRRDPNDQAQGT